MLAQGTAEEMDTQTEDRRNDWNVKNLQPSLKKNQPEKLQPLRRTPSFIRTTLRCICVLSFETFPPLRVSLMNLFSFVFFHASPLKRTARVEEIDADLFLFFFTQLPYLLLLQLERALLQRVDCPEAGLPSGLHARKGQSTAEVLSAPICNKAPRRTEDEKRTGKKTAYLFCLLSSASSLFSQRVTDQSRDREGWRQMHQRGTQSDARTSTDRHTRSS